jgi:dTDP-4-dehydrorhamnose reductase
VRKKILFTGGSGLLALNSAIYLRNDYEVYLGLHSRIINLQGVHTCLLDLENEQALEKELIRIKPDILINAAGMTNVEECELKPNEADKINAIVPGVIARLSKKLNIYFVHISTDHLFDGTKSFQTEEDIVSPLNVYGKSKAKGEQEVLKNNNEALIVRTNFFGCGTKYRKSFSDYIIENLQLGNHIDLFDDVKYTPILASTAASFINILIQKQQFGIYTIVSSEKITKYDFGKLIANKFGFNKSLINKSSIKSKLNLIQRPLDMSLSNLKFKNLIKLDIPTISTQIEELYNQQFEAEFIELKFLE